MGWLGSLIKGAAGLIPGVGTALDVASGIGGLISGGKAQGKSNKLLEQAMALKQQGWDARAPLRASSLAMAQQPMVGREDLSSVFSDPGNPYARSIPRPINPTTATPAAPLPAATNGRGFLGGASGVSGLFDRLKANAANQGPTTTVGGMPGGFLGQAFAQRRQRRPF